MPRVLRRRAISPQGRSSERGLPVQETPLTVFVHRSFPTATIGTVDMCDTDNIRGVISNIRLPECKPETFVGTL